MVTKVVGANDDGIPVKNSFCFGEAYVLWGNHALQFVEAFIGLRGMRVSALLKNFLF